ncbi:MAG: endonuclease NucS [Actinomycetota bacterium]|nr:endonuclease NucS [Actinomycetota bacterium]
MRLVIATCTVDYQGRLEAHLPPAPRLIMVKADGSVSVHADGGAYKPLNWMSPPCQLVEHPGRWEVVNAGGERLTILLEKVHTDTAYELGVDPGLRKDGVEAHLQVLLAAAPHALQQGLQLVTREFATDIGPVDLLCRDPDGGTVAVEVDGPRRQYVAVEIKRRAGIAAVEQLSRYLDRINLDGRYRPVRGILAAQSIAPQARVLAEDRGIKCVEVDYDQLRGARAADLTLF